MKKWIGSTGAAVAVAFLATLVLLVPAQAFEAKISGQVNQLIMWADNGIEDDYFIGDNENSSTRFRFTGSEEFDGFVKKIGFRIEFDAERNLSAKFDIPSVDDGEFRLLDRWFDASFEGNWGKFSIGKGSGAADGTAEVDLSGTAVITYAGTNDTSGGFTWKVPDGTSSGADFRTLSSGDGLTIGNTRNQFDGLSRNDRLRYDTPRFAGFRLAGSFTNGNAYELAGFYAAQFAGNKLAAALGYVQGQDREDFNQWGGSISWLAPFGLNVSLSYGMREFTNAAKAARAAVGDGDDAKNGYVKVGWKFAEIHAVSVEYGQTEDLNRDGDESKNYGGAYVVTPWKGVELYAAARVFQLETTVEPNDPEDISQVMAGTRIKF